jgi:hypothetical protein
MERLETAKSLSLAYAIFNDFGMLPDKCNGKNVKLFDRKDIPQDVVVPPSFLSRQGR